MFLSLLPALLFAALRLRVSASKAQFSAGGEPAVVEGEVSFAGEVGAGLGVVGYEAGGKKGFGF